MEEIKTECEHKRLSGNTEFFKCDDCETKFTYERPAANIDLTQAHHSITSKPVGGCDAGNCP